MYLYPHGEIWQLTANKCQSEIICARFTTIESGNLKEGINVFKLDQDNGAENELSDPLFSVQAKDLHHVSWMPCEESKLMVLAENQLLHFDMNSSNTDPVAVGKLQAKGFNELTYGAWNPHQNRSDLPLALSS